MDKEKAINDIEEAILDKLPESAIEKLAEFSDLEGDHDEEIKAILTENQIDINEIVKNVVKKEE